MNKSFKALLIVLAFVVTAFTVIVSLRICEIARQENNIRAMCLCGGYTGMEGVPTDNGWQYFCTNLFESVPVEQVECEAEE
jgi:hypothetical protein